MLFIMERTLQQKLICRKTRKEKRKSASSNEIATTGKGCKKKGKHCCRKFSVAT
jgi:hypothetical protein